MKKKMSLVFFGSGPVAAASLALLKNDFEIEAVITKPTTKNEMYSVLPEAKIHCVNTRAELDSLFESVAFTSEVGVLIDFGIIVSQKIIDYFPFGIINSHFSLLPELRGADPISFAILEGKQKTGVSLMLLVEAMDEGPLLTTGELSLNGSETTPELTDSLITLSNSLLQESIPSYIEGKIQPIDQAQIEKATGRKPSYTRKLTKQDGVIDWQKPAEVIEREIRAFSGWPKSTTKLGSIEVVITQAHVIPSIPSGSTPGDLRDLPEHKSLGVVTPEGTLVIDKLKPAGKKEMTIEAFLAGYRSRLNM